MQIKLISFPVDRMVREVFANLGAACVCEVPPLTRSISGKIHKITRHLFHCEREVTLHRFVIIVISMF